MSRRIIIIVLFIEILGLFVMNDLIVPNRPTTDAVAAQVRPPPIRFYPDLVITAIKSHTPSRQTNDEIVVPVTFVVANHGPVPAQGDIQLAAFMLQGRNSNVVRLSRPTRNDWYMYVTDVHPNAPQTVTGNILLPNKFSGQTVTLYIEVDSCSGQEFQPAYCRIHETDERNNQSQQIRVRLP